MPRKHNYAIRPAERGAEHTQLFTDQGEAETEAMCLSAFLNGQRVNVMKKSKSTSKWIVIQQIFA